MSSWLRMNRRAVSRPMPRDAPVTSAVLLIVVLLGSQEESCHLEIRLGRDLEVLVRAFDDVDREPMVGDEGGVLRVLDLLLHSAVMRLLAARSCALLGQLDGSQTPTGQPPRRGL